jgi:hypothetical protein
MDIKNNLDKYLKKYFEDLNLSIGVANLKEVYYGDILDNIFQPYKDSIEVFDYHNPFITSSITSTCCNQKFEFHAGITQHFLWSNSSDDSDLLGQEKFFNQFLGKNIKLCNCDDYKKALLENNTKDLFKYYPAENFIFKSYAQQIPFTGINEFQRVLGTVNYHGGEDCSNVYIFNNGKLDGQFYSYQLINFRKLEGVWGEDFYEYMFEHVEERISDMIHEFIFYAGPDDIAEAPVDIKNTYFSLVKKYMAEERYPVMDEYYGKFPIFFTKCFKKLWNEYLENYKNYGSHENFFTTIDPFVIVTETGDYKNNLKNGIFTNFNLDTNLVTYSAYKMGELIETKTDTVKFSAPFTSNGIKI